ncbi:MAG TPA: YrdB family protein, partial [Trueperaceae bacterium]
MSESFFKPASLALAFLFELGALAALAYWGFETGQGWAARIIFGLGAPVLAAVFWGTFLSPK